ncbi:UDP-glucose 6-dehydrogenase, partial [bacterium]|nr:UDP-glucose 6-dehydrogenase [bacterium]
IQSTIAANEGRMRSWAQRISSHLGGSIDGVKIAQLGLSFKANTDDVRASPAMLLARSLIARSVDLCVYDPEGAQNALQEEPDLKIALSALACAKDAQALVIATEWPEFSQIDLVHLRKSMRGDWIFDLRGVFDSTAVTEAGFIHYRVGHEIAYPDRLKP